MDYIRTLVIFILVVIIGLVTDASLFIYILIAILAIVSLLMMVIELRDKK